MNKLQLWLVAKRVTYVVSDAIESGLISALILMFFIVLLVLGALV